MAASERQTSFEQNASGQDAIAGTSWSQVRDLAVALIRTDMEKAVLPSILAVALLGTCQWRNQRFRGLAVALPSVR